MRKANPMPAVEGQGVRRTTALARAAMSGGLLFFLACIGCTEFATYGENRVRDLSDVLDVRYGTSFGLGAMVEVGPFGTGLGGSVEWYHRQWFGRKSVEVWEGLFAGGLLVVVDGNYPKAKEPNKNGNAARELSVLFFKDMGLTPPWRGDKEWFDLPGGDVPKLDRIRVGGVAFLPSVNGGLFLNAGEAVDFLCGIAGYDLNNDDGYPKFFTPAPESYRGALGVTLRSPAPGPPPALAGPADD